MRNRLMGLFLAWIAALAFSSIGAAQSDSRTNQRPAQPVQPVARVKNSTPPQAAAPRRDLDGVWAGPVQARLNATPPMTAWGQEQFATHKALGGLSEAEIATVPVAASNDPALQCDPPGFPRDVLWQIRGMQFIQAPNKMVQLFQYQRAWREIWTDGRELPKDAGGDDPGAPDPRYFGYSVGHWDGDYTFVVNSTGMDERTWIDHVGHPHSDQLRVEERYTRENHDTMQLLVNIDDPKTFTKPYTAATTTFTWNPKQEFEEQLCIASDAQAYMEIIGKPAAAPTK
jgi:hypothetical protein